MTTKAEIEQWFNRGVEQGATHMLVVCDTFDWDDYPVYVKDGQDARELAGKYPRNMQKLMEVYNLSQEVGPQLAQNRAFNY